VISPHYSIIVPVYNVERYLKQCVQSVLCQTYQDYELILVDDGSPDNCPALCDEYAKQDERIKVIHKENGGLSDARNAGLNVSTGIYIIFLDSDDYWCDQEGLQKIHDRIRQFDADVLIFGMKKFFQMEGRYSDVPVPVCDEVTLSHGQATKQLMERNIFVACACDKVVRHSLIIENGMSFVVGQLSEDIEWCSKLLLCCPKISILSETLYVYRQQNKESITANIGRKNLEHISTVILKYRKIAKAQNNIYLLNFMAEQYVLWLTVSNLVNRNEIKDLLEQMKECWDLVDNDFYPYVKMVKKLKVMGFSGVRYALKIYKQVKKHKIVK
jgi:glycosyltransferase involved in cell wall biosynthesis